MHNNIPQVIRPFAIAAAAILLLGSNPALACSCASKGDFVAYASQSAGVVRAKVVKYGDKLSHGETLYESMVVEVVAVITGDLETNTLVLMGDVGFLCREYVDSRNFHIGREYLIALHGDEAVQPFGGCGEAWLAVDGEHVVGHSFTADGYKEYTLSMQEVLEKLGSR